MNLSFKTATAKSLHRTPSLASSVLVLESNLPNYEYLVIAKLLGFSENISSYTNTVVCCSKLYKSLVISWTKPLCLPWSYLITDCAK